MSHPCSHTLPFYTSPKMLSSLFWKFMLSEHQICTFPHQSASSPHWSARQRVTHNSLAKNISHHIPITNKNQISILNQHGPNKNPWFNHWINPRIQPIIPANNILMLSEYTSIPVYWCELIIYALIACAHALTYERKAYCCC